MPNRRTVVMGLATASTAPLIWTGPFTINAFAQDTALTGDTVATSAGDITIHPVQHASLVLGFGDQVIYIDPVGGAEAYTGLPAATAILITHQHGDHFDVPTLEALAGEGVVLVAPEIVHTALPPGLKERTTLMANGQSGEVVGIPIDAVPAYNTTEERKQYHPQGVGNGYVLTLGDKKLYIAGDTEDTPEMRALTGIAVAFLPMNLPYTMAPEQAADAVKAFKPVIVYPYHFQGSDPQAFADLVGDAAEVRIGDWYAAG